MPFSAITSVAPTSPQLAAARALALRLLPGGVLWLDSEDLRHPGDHRAMRVPFTFAVGRPIAGSQHQVVHELELVVAASVGDGDTAVRMDLISYARFVVASGAADDTRLTGEALEAWLRQRPTNDGHHA